MMHVANAGVVRIMCVVRLGVAALLVAMTSSSADVIIPVVVRVVVVVAVAVFVVGVSV